MLRLLIVAEMASLLGVGVVNVAGYPLSQRLGGGPEGYGAMEALLGGGGLVGAALAGRVLGAGRVGAALVGAFVAMAAGLATAAAALALPVALAGLALGGLGRGLAEVTGTTLLQRGADDAVRSRVFAAQEAAAHVAFSGASLAGGVLVAASGPRAAIAVGAGCCAGAAAPATRVRAVTASSVVPGG